VTPQLVALTLADLTGNGIADIIATDVNGAVDVLLGNGAGAFGGLASYRVGTGATMTIVADLNHDGIPDLVVADKGDGVDVLLGTGGGRFGLATAFAVGTAPMGVTVADLNGDGISDIITAGPTPEILFGNGSGGFSAPVAYAGGSTGTSVAAVDLNGDGTLDLVVTNYGNFAYSATAAGATVPPIPGSIVVLLNDGTGHFNTAATYALGLGPNTATTIRDVNGDGRPDLFNIGLLYLGNADGTFTQSATTLNAVSGPLIDVNGDGLLDNVTPGGVGYGLPGGGFLAAGSLAASSIVAAGDLNGDGRPYVESGAGRCQL
jgi:hypothetical protein